MSSIFDDVVEVSRRTMVLFFLVDTSGSMKGEKIGTVNHTMEEVVPEIKNISETNADAQIKVAVLKFSTGSEWVTEEPVPADSFTWNYLAAEGITDFGEACLKLNEKLSRNEFMNERAGSFAPAIFLLSDGDPTDDYEKGLDRLKQNNWFKKAIKVAIAIGENANTEVLKNFTGNVESVITVHNAGELATWIKFVSVRASEIGSKSANVDSEQKSKQEDFVDAINKKKVDLSKKTDTTPQQDWGGETW